MELSTKAISEVYDAAAEGYDDLYQDEASLAENAAASMLIRLNIDHQMSRAHVIDIGCGTGLGFELGGHLVLNAGGHYTGIDVSKKMIAKAMYRVEEMTGVYPTLGSRKPANASGRAHFVHADARELLNEGKADLLLMLFSVANYMSPAALVGVLNYYARNNGKVVVIARRYEDSERRFEVPYLYDQSRLSTILNLAGLGGISVGELLAGGDFIYGVGKCRQ